MSYLQRKISLIVFDDKSVFLYCLYYISKKEKKRKKKLRISISKFAIRRIKVAGNKTDAREDVAVDTSRY